MDGEGFGDPFIDWIVTGSTLRWALVGGEDAGTPSAVLTDTLIGGGGADVVDGGWGHNPLELDGLAALQLKA